MWRNVVLLSIALDLDWSLFQRYSWPVVWENQIAGVAFMQKPRANLKQQLNSFFNVYIGLQTKCSFWLYDSWGK